MKEREEMKVKDFYGRTYVVSEKLGTTFVVHDGSMVKYIHETKCTVAR